MDLPLQIAFEDIPPSEDVRVYIGEEFAGLGELTNLIKEARIVLGRPQRRYHRADACRVHIQIEGFDGTSIAITRDPAITGNDEDVRATIADAFGSLRRRLVHLSQGTDTPGGPRSGAPRRR
jgi:hypothetical protein